MCIRNLHLLLYISAAALFNSFEDVTSADCSGFTCRNGQCASSNARCNSISDCADGSDEISCNTCSSGYFCDNGQCTQVVGDRCNSMCSCSDCSDEENCVTQAFPGDLRLVNQFGVVGTSGGRLEIYINNTGWGTVCDYGFDEYEADIICRELGYLYSSRVGNTSSLQYSEGTGSVVLDSVVCSSSDTRLLDCRSVLLVPPICSHAQDIALECTNQASPVRLVSESGRTSNLSAGRLEIYFNGLWGTVSDGSFSIADADVACRQMGFERANSFLNAEVLGYKMVPSSTPTWLGNLGCSSETTDNNDLRLCPHAGVGRKFYAADEDIILSCTSPGFIRLFSSRKTDTELMKYGPLEMYWDGAWGIVCDKPSFSYTTAQVACGQLGFSGVIEHGTIQSLGYFVSFTTDIWLHGVSCSSSSIDTLLNCSHNDIGSVSSSCGYFTYDRVGLSCSTFTNNREATTVSGGSSIGAGIGGFLTIVIFLGLIGFITYLVWVCEKRRTVNRRPNRSVIPTPAVASTTTTGGSAASHPTQPQGYPMQPLAVPPQTAQNQPERYPLAPQGVNPVAIPWDSTLQTTQPPSYESVAAPSGQTNAHSAPYPIQGQTAPAPYPTQGQTAPAPYPTQGQPPPAPYPSHGQIPPVPYPAQGQLPPAPYPAQEQTHPAPYPAQEQTHPAPYPGHGQAQLAPYSTQGGGSMATYPDKYAEGMVHPSAPQI